MHALLVGEEGLRGLAVGFHQEFLAVAAAAGIRNVSVIYRGIGISAGQHFVCVAMTVLAVGGCFARGGNLRVHAVRVGVFGISMAVGAKNLLRRSLVRQALHVFVAVHTGQLH